MDGGGGEALQIDEWVELTSDRSQLENSFKDIIYRWDDLMEGMLGKIFPILDVCEGDIVALPAPDGSFGGKWFFSTQVLRRVDDARIVQGDCVEISDVELVRMAFNTYKFRWDDQMLPMCNDKFRVVCVPEKNYVGLGSPDGSQGGWWYFHITCVRRVPQKLISVHARLHGGNGEPLELPDAVCLSLAEELAVIRVDESERSVEWLCGRLAEEIGMRPGQLKLVAGTRVLALDEPLCALLVADGEPSAEEAGP